MRVEQTDCQEAVLAIINCRPFAEPAFPILLAETLVEHPRVPGTNGRFRRGSDPQPQHRFEGRVSNLRAHSSYFAEPERRSASNGNLRRYSSKDAKSSSALRQHSRSPASAKIS